MSDSNSPYWRDTFYDLSLKIKTEDGNWFDRQYPTHVIPNYRAAAQAARQYLYPGECTTMNISDMLDTTSDAPYFELAKELVKDMSPFGMEIPEKIALIATLALIDIAEDLMSINEQLTNITYAVYDNDKENNNVQFTR